MKEEQVKKIKQDFLTELAFIEDEAALEALKIKYLGRKAGLLTVLLNQLSELSIEDKKIAGPLVNQIKNETENLLAKKLAEIQNKKNQTSFDSEKVDITQPVLPPQERGHLHPLTLVQKELEDLFVSMGFMILDGPELESEYYNFEAVNIPKTHPARDMQDTFYIKNHPNWLMRTHTSSMQVRAMQKYGAPLRMIVSGKCFRNEATDARHEHTLYQLEGVVIDKTINFSHLKATLETVAKHLYGPETRVRLRPKFYPFVEPGANGEVSCFLCQGKGCRLCKQSGWLEIFGAGLIHPNVLKAGGLDFKKYQGFAFGFGLDRLVMLKYGLNEIRVLRSGDLRFIKQF